MQMSDFLGSSRTREGDTVAAPAPVTWWNWNPARRPATVVTTAAPPPVRESWWNANPARRQVVDTTTVTPATTVAPVAGAAPARTMVDGPGRDEIRRAAYAEGRRDERRQRRGSPVASFMVILAAIGGAAFVILAMLHGGFAGGGAVVDQEIGRLPGQAASVAHSVRTVADRPTATPAPAPTQTP